MSTSTPAPRVVVMGASGCGKSTVGTVLARLLGVPFLDADDLHPPRNIARMAAGTPLTDDDRAPWLVRVGVGLATAPSGAVVACSALRRSYRRALLLCAPDAVFVHLAGTRDQLAARVSARPDHFMPASLLGTQLTTLEPLGTDEPGIVLGITSAPDRLATEAAAWLRATGRAAPTPAGGAVSCTGEGAVAAAR